MSKVTLVTGSARGIGAAIIEELASAGYDCVINYLTSERDAYELNEKIKKYNVRSLVIKCDVSKEEEVNDMFCQIEKELGGVDILINNAGIAHYGLISQISDAEWDRLFSVNVGGIYRCVKAVLPAMLQKQSGCILNLSSMWGQVGASCEVAYSASKGAVIAMTKALAKELGPSGIRVNCVCPGVILTDMTRCIGEDALSELAEETPLGRNGTPEDVAAALLYLAQADFITGQILPVNGGFVI